MKYRVDVSNAAEATIYEYLRYIAVECAAPQAAQRMPERIDAAVGSLNYFPHRCPFAPENELRDYEIRMRLVHSCLLIFTVNDETQTVNVLDFRHGRQEPRDSALPDSI